MLLQTNSYIVPKERRAEHARLLRRFRQILLRLGCDDFEVFEQMGPNWKAADATGRFVQLMRFRDRKHQRQVHAAEQSDPQAQQLINEFCDLINLPYQQQQGLLAIGYYQSVVEVPNVSGKNRGAAAAMAEEEEAAEEQPMGFGGFGLTGAPAAMHPVSLEEEQEAEAPQEAVAEETVEEEAVAEEPVAEEAPEEQAVDEQPAEAVEELPPELAAAEPGVPAESHALTADDLGFTESTESELPAETAPLELDIDAIMAEELQAPAEAATAEPAAEAPKEPAAEPLGEEVAPEPAWEAHVPPVADTSLPAIAEPPHAELPHAEFPHAEAGVAEQPVPAEEPVAATAEHDLEPPSLDDFLLAELAVAEEAPAPAESHAAEPGPTSFEAESAPIEAEPIHAGIETHEAAPIAELESPEPEEIEAELAAPPEVTHGETELPHGESLSPLDVAHGLSELDLDELHPSEIAPMEAMGHHAPPPIAEAPVAESHEQVAPLQEPEPVASELEPASHSTAEEEGLQFEPEQEPAIAAEIAPPLAASMPTVAAAAPATNGKETWHDHANGLPIHLTAEEADIEIIYEAIPEGVEQTV